MTIEPLHTALIFATIGGITMPLGALLADIKGIRPRWLERELRHSVIAFGGGVLLAAVALVLVPDGVGDIRTGTDSRPYAEALTLAGIVLAFAGGGLVFMLVDRLLAKTGGSAAQLMAMLLDFVPEAMALGATLTRGGASGPLLALLIAMQNLPEGFNASRELVANRGWRRRNVVGWFAGLVVLGPGAAWFGHAFLAPHPVVLGMVMLFAAGGILYLTYQDIAPRVPLERHWGPPLGAVGGFLFGLVGHVLIG